MRKAKDKNRAVLDDKELKEANDRFNETAIDFKKDTVSFDANIKGLEPLAQELDETGKKILNVILTDWSAENEVEAEKDVFKKLRNACARAGMLGNKSNEIKFFKTLADAQFMNIVKTTGQGLVGIYIIPIVSKVIAQALEGDKTSQRWAMEITGILPSKFDFYLTRWNLTHVDNVNQINYQGKTDDELAEIATALRNVPEAEVASGAN